MEIRVAVGAILAHIGKDRLDVAARARHLLMHAAQRILCRVVIKFRDRADGRPARGRMAVLARNIQTAVRTLLRLALRCRGGQSRSEQTCGKYKQNAEPPGDMEDAANNSPHNEKELAPPLIPQEVARTIYFSVTPALLCYRPELGPVPGLTPSSTASQPIAAGGLAA